jgi:Tol biopolymer transport system component
VFTRLPGWITLGVEMDAPNWPPLVCDQKCKDGLLISGINANLWAVKTDGSQWVLLKKWDPAHPELGQGFTGPAYTPDGSRGYWADIVDGDVLVYGFGKWRLQRSDFALDSNGVLTMSNTTDVTPDGANWVEPGNISPDGKKLLLNMDIGLPANNTFGQDQFILDLETSAVTNLTNSPTAWDEHGLFSPDGKKIVWMSSKPYPDATWVGNLRTDFMLMDADGSNVQQLTHFNQPGYPESLDAGSVAAVAGFTPDGRHLQALDQWDVGTQKLYLFDFNGACGLSP